MYNIKDKPFCKKNIQITRSRKLKKKILLQFFYGKN